MEFELKPNYNPNFSGREKELQWLDEHLLRRRISTTPIIIVGQGGIGKTALVKQWFATRRLTYTPLWINLSERLDEQVIDELILQLREPSERHFASRLTVVLDGAESWLENQLEHAIRRIYNYKIVSSVVVITRQQFEIKRAQQLQLQSLDYSSSEDLIQGFLESHLTVDQFNQAYAETKGNPLALTLLAQVLKNGDFSSVMASLKSGPIYQLPKEIILPEKEIIAVTKPIIVSTENRLIKALKQQPSDLRSLGPRDFEILLADLLKDMGWDVELTKQTRDGGADILAYMNTPLGRFLCLVEAKHYREDRKVGVDLVRTLYGTLFDAQANSAMLVTSSSFTKDAQDFQKKHQYQLSLRGYTDIVNWILQYGTNNKN